MTLQFNLFRIKPLFQAEFDIVAESKQVSARRPPSVVPSRAKPTDNPTLARRQQNQLHKNQQYFEKAQVYSQNKLKGFLFSRRYTLISGEKLEHKSPLSTERGTFLSRRPTDIPGSMQNKNQRLNEAAGFSLSFGKGFRIFLLYPPRN